MPLNLLRYYRALLAGRVVLPNQSKQAYSKGMAKPDQPTAGIDSEPGFLVCQAPAEMERVPMCLPLPCPIAFVRSLTRWLLEAVWWATQVTNM